jgi:hypothetical protein
VSFATITLYVASQRAFIVVSVYFVIESVRKLLDTYSYDPPPPPSYFPLAYDKCVTICPFEIYLLTGSRFRRVPVLGNFEAYESHRVNFEGKWYSLFYSTSQMIHLHAI